MPGETHPTVDGIRGHKMMTLEEAKERERLTMTWLANDNWCFMGIKWVYPIGPELAPIRVPLINVHWTFTPFVL